MEPAEVDLTALLYHIAVWSFLLKVERVIFYEQSFNQ